MSFLLSRIPQMFFLFWALSIFKVNFIVYPSNRLYTVRQSTFYSFLTRTAFTLQAIYSEM